MQNRISISIYNISDNNVDCNQIDNNHMLRKDNKEYTSSNLMTGEIRILQFYLMSSETPFQYCVSSFSVKTGGHTQGDSTDGKCLFFQLISIIFLAMAKVVSVGLACLVGKLIEVLSQGKHK